MPLTVAARKSERTTGWQLAGTVSFVLALALVAARSLMMEILRDPFQVLPGSAVAPRGAGAGASLFLDLAMCLPALIILARRVFDRTFTLALPWSFITLSLLALWAMLSTGWSSDKFSAIISATQLVSAVALAFAAVQLVRSWARLRIVAALMLGLLLAYLAHGAYYRTVDLPELRENWEKNKAQILLERNWDPQSFAATQFEKKVLAGDMVGFHASPNTFAAVVVVCLTVTLGFGADLFSKKRFALLVPFGLISAGAGWLLYISRCRAAVVTSLLAVVTLIALVRLRPWLARHWRRAYFITVLAIVLGAAAVIGHGLAHGNLVHDSLTFRWKYWVASARIFAAHPAIGVGYSNFSVHYLGVRLPEAAEEIRDPHNFVVRIFTELGAIGGLLLIAWLLRVGWEMARPTTQLSRTQRTSTRSLIVLAFLGLAISLATSVDWSQQWSWWTLETIRRVLLFMAVLAGLLMVSIRSLNSATIDAEPSPWLLSAIIVGIALFAIHNTIDFAGFEAGPMFMLFLLIGSVLGARTPLSAKRRSTAPVTAGFAVGVVGLTAGLIGLAIPVALAEGHAHNSDEYIRDSHFPDALHELDQSISLVSYNADYYNRAARVLALGGAPENRIRPMLDAVIAHDPMSTQGYLTRGRWLASKPLPDPQNALADFARALELNPNDLDIRMDYAQLLERFGHHAQAAEQYKLVLQYNDLLDPNEPKRLTKQKIGEIETQMNADEHR